MPDAEMYPEQQTDGERWLVMIGCGNLIGQQSGYTRDGRTYNYEEFPEICGQTARDAFIGMEAMDPNHPEFKESIEALRAIILMHVSIAPAGVPRPTLA